MVRPAGEPRLPPGACRIGAPPKLSLIGNQSVIGVKRESSGACRVQQEDIARRAVQRVLLEHRELDTAAADLERLVAFGPANRAEVFSKLAGYASLLAEHLIGEHEVIREAEDCRTARGEGSSHQARTELEALRWDWEEYLSVWTDETAASDWDTFAEHSLVILARIRRRIAREDDLLSQT